MKALVFVVALGVGHPFADHPAVPSPPVVTAFDPARYVAECQQLAQDWVQLQQLEQELGR